MVIMPPCTWDYLYTGQTLYASVDSWMPAWGAWA